MLSIRKALVTLLITLFVLVNVAAITTASTPANNNTSYTYTPFASNNTSYPSITIHLTNGNTYTITGNIWTKDIMPLILNDRQIAAFNWSNTLESSYIFFDYSFRGLNPFGAEFIYALETYTNVTNATIKEALISILPLPSVNAPYTNGQALNLGILPGLSSTSLIKSSNPAQYYPEIVIISLIALVIILHYVFKRM